jgi:putative heme-binding domain-containing protein
MLLAKYSGPGAAAKLMANFNARTPVEREVILNAMMLTEPLTLALFKLTEPTAFDSNRRAQLSSHPNKAIREAAQKFFSATAVSARKEVLEKYKTALTLPGDAAKGRQVFTTSGCVACHQLDGVGIPLGPDLRTVVQHTNEKLFNSILDPSAIIEPGFTAYHCTLNNGEQLYGIITTETSGSLTLKLPGNILRSVLRSDVKQLQSTKTSLMPEGLEAALTPQSLADLMAYLQLQK